MLLVIKTKHSDNNTIKHRNNRHIIFIKIKNIPGIRRKIEIGTIIRNII